MTQEQTVQSFEDLIRSLQENGVGADAPAVNVFSVFDDNITDMTPANFYAAFGDSDSLTVGDGVYRIVRNLDGSVRSLNFTDNWGNMSEVESLENYLNSNTTMPEYDPASSFTYTHSTNIDLTSGDVQTVNLTGGVSKYANGILQSQSRVTAAGLLSAIPLAAGIGVKLGKAIDGSIYKLIEAFGGNPPESLNPETWSRIAVGNDAGSQLFRTLFDIDPTTGLITQYIDAEAAAYLSLWLKEQGIFETPGETAHLTPEQDPSVLPDPAITSVSTGESGYIAGTTDIYNFYGEGVHFVRTGQVIQAFAEATGSAPRVTVEQTVIATGVKHTSYTWITGNYNTYINNTPFRSQTLVGIPGSQQATSSLPDSGLPSNTLTTTRQIGTLLYDGTITVAPAVPGVSDNGGTVPNTTGWTTPANTLTSLQQQYPELWNDRIEEIVTNPDGSQRTYTYIPFDLPNEQTEGNPDTQTNDPTETEVNPETATQTKLQTIIELLTNPNTTTLVDPTTSTQTGTNDTNPTSNPNPPDTGTGNQSPFVAPIGSASSLWAVYHPSQAQLNAFGAWLWSSDFVEQLKRLFNDPMQAIIGVHKVFAPIPTGGSSTIKCGFLDSGVSSPTVSSQYTEVNCGTVDCREYFGNVFDYDPHTKVSIYLPFIGVVPLKVSEVMRGKINVTYGVDVITGACLAKVKVTRDGSGAVLYSYGGSCACHYPISSGSYAGIISGIVTSAIGIAGGIAAGSPMMAIGGVMAGVRQAHTDVQRSGGFTGCAGAMGPKKPYLIITRPQTRVANDVQLYEGKPSNATQLFGDCTGFVRATEVHFSSQAAFDDEAKEVEALLKSGVLISD